MTKSLPICLLLTSRTGKRLSVQFNSITGCEPATIKFNINMSGDDNFKHALEEKIINGDPWKRLGADRPHDSSYDGSDFFKRRGETVESPCIKLQGTFLATSNYESYQAYVGQGGHEYRTYPIYRTAFRRVTHIVLETADEINAGLQADTYDLHSTIGLKRYNDACNQFRRNANAAADELIERLKQKGTPSLWKQITCFMTPDL